MPVREIIFVSIFCTYMDYQLNLTWHVGYFYPLVQGLNFSAEGPQTRPIEACKNSADAENGYLLFKAHAK